MLASCPETCKIIEKNLWQWGRVLGRSEYMHNEIKYKSRSVIMREILTRLWEVMLEVPCWWGLLTIPHLSSINPKVTIPCQAYNSSGFFFTLFQTVLKGGKRYHIYLMYFLNSLANWWNSLDIFCLHLVLQKDLEQWFSIMIGGIVPICLVSRCIRIISKCPLYEETWIPSIITEYLCPREPMLLRRKCQIPNTQISMVLGGQSLLI